VPVNHQFADMQNLLVTLTRAQKKFRKGSAKDTQPKQVAEAADEAQTSPTPQSPSPSSTNQSNAESPTNGRPASKERVDSYPSPSLTAREKARLSDEKKILESLRLIEQPVTKKDLVRYCRKHFSSMLDSEVTKILKFLLEDKEVVKTENGDRTLYALSKEIEVEVEFTTQDANLGQSPDTLGEIPSEPVWNY